MQELGEKLTESRSLQKLGAKEELAADPTRRFDIYPLGLREAIYGLLAKPTGDYEWDIDGLREQEDWQLQGDWFPYELIVDEFIFVIDDDGSIFVSTANLPRELREKAGGLLQRVIRRLYA